jgi:hypothetical protein
VTAGGWTELPKELVEKVLEELLTSVHLRRERVGASKALATVRLVSTGWMSRHDTLVVEELLRIGCHRRGGGRAGATLPGGGVAGPQVLLL